MLHHATFSLRVLEITYLYVACCRMFSSHSLTQNALVNNDDALKQSLNLKFSVQEKKASRDFTAENLYHDVAVGTKRANILALM